MFCADLSLNPESVVELRISGRICEKLKESKSEISNFSYFETHRFKVLELGVLIFSSVIFKLIYLSQY